MESENITFKTGGVSFTKSFSRGGVSRVMAFYVQW
jgi:hypothetical protein